MAPLIQKLEFGQFVTNLSENSVLLLILLFSWSHNSKF